MKQETCSWLSISTGYPISTSSNLWPLLTNGLSTNRYTHREKERKVREWDWNNNKSNEVERQTKKTAEYQNHHKEIEWPPMTSRK